MTDWRDYYKQRQITIEEGVAMIHSGDVIAEGQGLGRTDIFVDPLVDRANELSHVKIISADHYNNDKYMDPKFSDSFEIHSLYLNAGEIGSRTAFFSGRCEYYPVPFSRQSQAIKRLEPDFYFVQVTPPDENGNVSLGVSADFSVDIMSFAKTIIAHVNNNMPWTDGDTVFPVNAIDYFVLKDEPLTEYEMSEILSETDTKIAQNVASLIHDGDTLQIGNGSVPDKVMKLLSDHQHLGIHTELGSMGLMRLMQSGVIDNSKKTLDRGKSVFALLAGYQELYDYADHNPNILLRSASYVCNPMVIAQQKNFVSICSCIQVDMLGQVVSDMIGDKQFSGIGGQLDFIRGAGMSEGGRAIICMPSTAAKGKVSRIVPFINTGAAVSDTRYDAMYIVTEYGVANLWNRSVREKAEALIQIAHPDFRDELEKSLAKMIHKI